MLNDLLCNVDAGTAVNVYMWIMEKLHSRWCLFYNTNHITYKWYYMGWGIVIMIMTIYPHIIAGMPLTIQ